MRWIASRARALSLPLLLLSGCSGGGGVFSASPSAFSGYVAVASGSSNTVALFDASGAYVRTLRDLNSPSSETPVALLPSNEPGSILLGVYGVGRIERLSLADGSHSSLILNTTLATAYPRGVAKDGSGNYLVTNTGAFTIEKFSPAGLRIGAPFIAMATGGCTLSNPWTIAVLSDGAIAVGNGGTSGVLIYEPDGTCRASVAAAPFNANLPRTVAYHALHDKLIVAFYSTGAIYAIDPDGTNATLIYQNTTYIQNPTALAVDSSGVIYVGSTSQDTVEKLSFDGSTATRVGTVPFITASQFTLSPAAIEVVP
jgi:hypothetical protein